MKLLLQKKGSSPVVMLAAASISFLGLAQPVLAANYSVSAGTFDVGGLLPPGDDILIPGPAPIIPGSPGIAIDVDAFSYGRAGSPGTGYNFSVDFTSFGAIGSSVASEVGAGGLGEQNVDVFSTDIVATPGTNFQVHDGNGLPPGGVAFPLGLLEPYLPGISPNPSDPGVDGYDTRFGPPGGPLSPIYFSWDPFSAPISASAADVLFAASAPGYSSAGVVYATGAALGLDAFGIGTDNIDALEIYDTGLIGIYDAGDVVLFSLDRGSASLGLLGATPGDVLVASFGGPTGVFVTEATLGLAPGDNLTALSIVPEPSSALLFVMGIAALGLRRRR